MVAKTLVEDLMLGQKLVLRWSETVPAPWRIDGHFAATATLAVPACTSPQQFPIFTRDTPDNSHLRQEPAQG